MDQREQKIAEEKLQKQLQRDARRQSLAEEQDARKADWERRAIAKRKMQWQDYFGSDGVVMKASIHDAILGEPIPYMED
jgi:hypothetical protein